MATLVSQSLSPQAGDYDALVELNLGYIRSVQHSDVGWFDQHLADDFLCSRPDGTLIDKAAFLAATAPPATIANLAIADVNIRLLDDVAIIHAKTLFDLSDGRPAFGRYTDIWAKREGRWLCVAAHVTRC